MVEVMNVNEVAEALHISKTMVYKAAKNGDLPCFRVGARILFNAERIEELINGEKKESNADEEPKQNTNRHRINGTIRTRRLRSARLG